MITSLKDHYFSEVSLSEHFFSNLRGDFFGGLTTAIVALPLALGFGVAAGIDQLNFGSLQVSGAFCGLIGAIVVGAIAALFGGTPAQISGPTGPLTVVVASFVSGFTGDPRWVFATFALAGFIQMMLGAMRIGRYVNYIPYPVVSGFMSGIGIIIILLQIPSALGVRFSGSPFGALLGIPGFLSHLNLHALLFSLGTVALIYAIPRLTKAIPGPLVALVLMTGVEIYEHFDVPVIGDIPRGVPRILMPESMDMAMLSIVFPTALMLAAIASIDSLLTSVVHDQVTKTRHESDRELFGQGLGNFLSGLFGGLPSAGATMRTVVNVRSGGRTRLSGVVHSAVLVLVLVFLRPIAEQIPLAVLAGILITVGIGIIDYKGIRHLLNVPRGDAAVLVTTLGLTVVVDLLTAIAVGMTMACFVLMKRLADMKPARYGPLMDAIPNHPWMPDLEVTPAQGEGMVFVELSDMLFFGNAGAMHRTLGPLAEATAIILSLRNVRYLDQSGAYALADLIGDLRAGDTLVFLTDVDSEAERLLTKLDVIGEALPAEKVSAAAELGIAAAIDRLHPTRKSPPLPSLG